MNLWRENMLVGQNISFALSSQVWYWWILGHRINYREEREGEKKKKIIQCRIDYNSKDSEVKNVMNIPADGNRIILQKDIWLGSKKAYWSHKLKPVNHRW